MAKVDFMDGAVQRQIDDFVRQHVCARASVLVSELSKLDAVICGEYAEELNELQVHEDWEDPVIEWLDAGADYEGLLDVYDWLGEEPPPEEERSMDQMRSDLRALILDADAWREVAEHAGLDPYLSEIYEHWVVDDFLGHWLKKAGEVVVSDFYGLRIWGRRTTGQSIAMDYVIQKIWRETEERMGNLPAEEEA